MVVLSVIARSSGRQPMYAAAVSRTADSQRPTFSSM